MALDTMTMKTEEQYAITNNETYSCWHVVSNVIFVIASCFYLALSTTDLDLYRFYKDVPASVLYATDDGIWLQYFMETNGHDNVDLNATDGWYNNSFYPHDDIVFQINPDKESTAVSQYIILYFCAALGFLITGFIEVWLAPTLASEALYSIFVVAAAFGVGSSVTVVANESLSSVFNSISVHLFAIEAISVAVRACRRDEPTEESWILWIGHVSLVIGTIMDVVLSYYYLFERATLPHVRTGIAAAFFWLLCSLIYLGNSVQLCNEARRHVQYQHSGRSSNDDNAIDKHKQDEIMCVFEDEQSV